MNERICFENNALKAAGRLFAKLEVVVGKLTK